MAVSISVMETVVGIKIVYLVGLSTMTRILLKPDDKTSGYPWSDPIRLNNFSLALSLVGIFLHGIPGTKPLGWPGMPNVPNVGPF